MATTPAPRPTGPRLVLNVQDIRRDGGMVRYNWDAEQLVTFTPDLAARRTLELMRELYG